jgi:acetate kinase
MAEIVLALNAGSSTLKYTLYRLGDGREDELAGATVTAGGSPPAELLERVLGEIAGHGFGEPALVGHRVVHGGSEFSAPIKVDAATLARLRGLTPLAPLHLPPAIDLIQHALERCASAGHVACFDTAFHRRLPEVARRFALPSELHRGGVQRYGFHGLSYEYIVSALPAPLPERLIVAHLGSGASLCAIRAGESVDTSMGLTPSGGVPMGTRSGDLDPGLLLYLMRERGYDADRLEQLLNHESGLLGVGGSADAAELSSRAAAGEPAATAALELFSYAVKKQVGAYVAALGGVDCLVFTGGIGEHAPLVRELACSGLGALGIELDPALNAVNAPVISRRSSPCRVRVLPTNEDLVIARSAYAVWHAVDASATDES